jgi:hypothetical protein
MDDTAEYWIGKNVDYTKLWDAYNSGKDDYQRKFHSMKTVPIKIEFDLPHHQDPLFNLEAIYKTLKGLYFDFKQYCLTDNEFNSAGPLFVYSIERGSAEWTILLEATHAAPFIWALLKAYHEFYKIKKTKLECKVLEHQVEEINRAREENNKEKIEQRNIDKFIQDKKPALENLLSQQIKQVTIKGILIGQVIINFDSPEAEPKKPEPPMRKS